MKTNSYIAKLAYLSKLVKIVDNGRHIMIRGRRFRKVVLYALSPFFLLYGFMVKSAAQIRLALLEHGVHYKYRFAVVAIARNEADYIEEWVAYHQLIGFDCIILYDNESTDGMKERIKKYIDEGFVKYHYIKGESKQHDAYNDALLRYGNQSKYMAFFDIDEFLVSSNPDDNALDIIEGGFSKDRNIGAVGVHWYVYGSSGHVKKTDGLVMERFLYRATSDEEQNWGIKSIVKPNCVRKYIHAHYPALLKGYYKTGLDQEIIEAYSIPIDGDQRVRFNHYITKSLEEWTVRRSKPGGDGFIRPTADFAKHDKNEVKDEVTLYYIDKVKETMAQHRVM